MDVCIALLAIAGRSTFLKSGGKFVDKDFVLLAGIGI